MLQPALKAPRHILMTLDAVGGVWRYSLDLCRSLGPRGVHFLLVGLGPEPSKSQWEEVQGLRNADVVWLDIPLDWQAENAEQIAALPDWLGELARRWLIDLMHLNLPSQAAGLHVDCPVLAASHSCLATWWQAVHREPLPAAWQWNRDSNARGLAAADLIVTPSRSHAAALERVYGRQRAPVISVPNGTAKPGQRYRKTQLVLSAGRWWDDGKNGAVIDAAAETIDWPVLMAGPLTGPAGQEIRLLHACPLGERQTEDMRRLMGRASIFTSVSLFEPFGLAVLEAAAAEAALVLSDIPTFREFWDGAAVFVDPHDPDAVSAAVNQLIDDRQACTFYATAARERAASYTLEAQADKMQQIYAAMLQRQSRSLTAAE